MVPTQTFPHPLKRTRVFLNKW